MRPTVESALAFSARNAGLAAFGSRASKDRQQDQNEVFPRPRLVESPSFARSYGQSSYGQLLWSAVDKLCAPHTK
jgi:hypothetical protein